jgi:hypothetical protein
MIQELPGRFVHERQILVEFFEVNADELFESHYRGIVFA